MSLDQAVYFLRLQFPGWIPRLDQIAELGFNAVMFLYALACLFGTAKKHWTKNVASHDCNPCPNRSIQGRRP
jgi:hypothetical protein